MSDMSGALQNRISPPVPKYTTTEFSDAKVDDQVGKQKGCLYTHLTLPTKRIV